MPGFKYEWTFRNKKIFMNQFNESTRPSHMFMKCNVKAPNHNYFVGTTVLRRSNLKYRHF